jgi:hypothetical protein
MLPSMVSAQRRTVQMTLVLSTDDFGPASSELPGAPGPGYRRFLGVVRLWNHSSRVGDRQFLREQSANFPGFPERSTRKTVWPALVASPRETAEARSPEHPGRTTPIRPMRFWESSKATNCEEQDRHDRRRLCNRLIRQSPAHRPDLRRRLESPIAVSQLPFSAT